MARRWISITLVIAMSGCGAPPDRSANENSPVREVRSSQGPPNSAPADVPPAHADIGRPGTPGGLPDDRAPIAEGAIDPASARGAGLVLQRYAGLLEQKKFAEARRLWSDGGKASGLTDREFAASFEPYATIHSEIGRPGEPEGAAGSIYVEIPFRLYGTRRDGKPFNRIGSAALRRSNDVPGSSAEDRRWHIHSMDLKPGA